MSTVQRPSPPPIDDLLERAEKGVEVIDGRVVEKTVSLTSQVVANRIAYLLTRHCDLSSAGVVLPELGYTCFRDRMRRPDISLIRSERMTPDLYESGFSPIRPDLAVEVVSLHDGYREVEEKLADYRDAAIPLVWVVEPSSRRVRVIRGDGSTSELGIDQELTGEAILPEFRCRVADLFDGLPTPTVP